MFCPLDTDGEIDLQAVLTLQIKLQLTMSLDQMDYPTLLRLRGIIDDLITTPPLIESLT